MWRGVHDGAANQLVELRLAERFGHEFPDDPYFVGFLIRKVDSTCCTELGLGIVALFQHPIEHREHVGIGQIAPFIDADAFRFGIDQAQYAKAGLVPILHCSFGGFADASVQVGHSRRI
jgi:hypothetical protein